MASFWSPKPFQQPWSAKLLDGLKRPLRVLPGSHRHGVGMTWNEAGAETILCETGDVLPIRPLVVHGSIASAPGCTTNRRILHLEFAANAELPGGLEWRWFVPVD